MSCVLGIDIGGTNTEFGLVDREGKIHFSSRVKTRQHATPESLAQSIYDTLQSDVDDIQITAIGIGTPNGNYYKGTIEFAPNLEWKGVIELAKIFQGQFELPVKVANDANAAAHGEMLFGAARGLRDFLVVTLGTGLGSGFVCNGEVLYGNTGMAGELGHVVIHPAGRECKCGRKGCLERYASSTGFMITTKELLELTDSASPLKDIPSSELHASDVDKAARNGDVLALEVFNRTARELARGLATAVAITSPEVIILCGGLAKSGELLLEPTRRCLEEELLQVFKKTVAIRASGLRDGNVAILGAAALGWK